MVKPVRLRFLTHVGSGVENWIGTWGCVATQAGEFAQDQPPGQGLERAGLPRGGKV